MENLTHSPGCGQVGWPWAPLLRPAKPHIVTRKGGSALLGVALLMLPFQAAAWGIVGHRITAEVAARHLTPSAQAQVTALLDEGEGIADAAAWPDLIRSQQTPFREASGYWHYVTLRKGRYTQAPPQGDAVTALMRFARTLGDVQATREDQQTALRFIIHIIGDLHQPLHVSKPEDLGGNTLELVFHGEPTNLHRLWDTNMIARQNMSIDDWVQLLGEHATEANYQRWHTLDVRVWIAESQALHEAIYPASEELHHDELSPDYAPAHLSILRQRLTQAALRIAAFLNNQFAN